MKEQQAPYASYVRFEHSLHRETCRSSGRIRRSSSCRALCLGCISRRHGACHQASCFRLAREARAAALLLWGASLLLAWGLPPVTKSVGGRRLGGVNRQVIAKQSTCTNHRNRGRTSADRSTEATLMLTVPRSLIKSSTKDLT